MRNELSDRQAAIRRRLAGENVESIYRSVQRSEVWFHKWWQRYLAQGPESGHPHARPRRMGMRALRGSEIGS